jgi:multicomponent Na+:H+ antiporter subunit D
MTNLLILPVILPFFIGTLLILFAKNHPVQRVISIIASVVMVAVSTYLAWLVYHEGILVLTLGDWAAPFGIVLVGDTLATMMVAVSSIVGLVCLLFATQTIARKRQTYYFYPFYFFLMVGVNGAFLTGDLFNLFVFFEVMLVSSYMLIVMGGTKYQLRESFKYVVINVFASVLFIIGVAYLYAVTGTLNMAHLAQRIAEVEQTGILNVIAVLFFVVFAMKGGLFPLYFWLPNAYSGPPAAVTALFGGLLTKVGIYAILRTFTLIFTHNTDFLHQFILIIAGLTMVIGGIGAVSQFDFRKILSFHIISQVGYMVMGLGIYTQLAIAGAIYFIVHNMIVKTALFLFAGATQYVTGTSDLKKMGGVLKTHPVLGWLFGIAAISIAGIPPFSGFFSKLAVILGGFLAGNYVIAGVGLAVGMLTLFSMIKIFSYVFWGEQKHSEEQAAIKVDRLLWAIVPLIVLTTALGFGAEPMFQYTMQAAEQIIDPSIYIDAVLKE